jgi:SNF2 family DNA or RNA helicase
VPFTIPPLLPHQEVVKDFIVQNPKCGIFLTMGGGKCLATLAALAAVRPTGHILVVAPVNIARSTWIDEIEKWGFPLRTRSFIVNDNDKKLTKIKRLQRYEDVFSDEPTMYFINVELIDDLVNQMPVQTINGQKTIMWPFQTVIVDESQTLKNPGGVRFKALRKVAPAIVRLIELTGTPTPNGLMDLWSQMFLLDGGLALGKTLTEYRERYFVAAMMIDNRPLKWELRPGAAEEI